MGWYHAILAVFVKLSEKSSVAGIEKQLNGLLKSNQPKDAEGKGDSREFALLTWRHSF